MKTINRLLSLSFVLVSNSALAADQAVTVNITGKTEGAYSIGAAVRPITNSRQPRALMDTSVANAISEDQQSNSSSNASSSNASSSNASSTDKDKKPSSSQASVPTGSGNVLLNKQLQKALDESNHHVQGSSGSSGSSGGSGSVSAKDFEKDLLGDFQMATATHEDYEAYLAGLGSRVKDFMQSAVESELPILEVQHMINNLQNQLEQEARRRNDKELEEAIARALGALRPETEQNLRDYLANLPDPPKPPIDTSAPLDDQRRQAVDNDDYNHLASLGRQETGGNLRKERDHFAEAMNAAANVAGNENATPAQRAAARQFAQNLAGYFNSLGGRMTDDPLFTDSCNILSATCDNIAHWKEPPW